MSKGRHINEDRPVATCPGLPLFPLSSGLVPPCGSWSAHYPHTIGATPRYRGVAR